MIPAYNASEFLPQTLESVLAQTYKSMEVIVVDDGSTDDTRGCVSAYLSDSRVCYHWKENGGDGSARNEGIRIATAPYVAFVDADDLWYPDKLEKQMPLFDQKIKPGIVFSDRDLINEKGEPILGCQWPLFRGDRLYERLLIQNFVPTSAAVVAREVFGEVGLFDESIRYVCDRDFWLRASLKFPFDFVPKALEAHRKWGNQMTSNKLAFAEAALQLITRFIREHQDLIDASLESEIWSTAYARRGICLGESGRYPGALKDLLYAIRKCPTNRQAGKSLVKLMIGRL
ncbi:glycosyltransferase family 2 protein [Novipirellula sp.]|uniref:glycosyltransferase family 2 protein n=1 Tax=Novipirellula sp. TaxID=2795430 RepID=UPI003565DECF